MKNDIHIIEQEAPGVVGDVKVLCRIIVENAQIACLWDERNMGDTVDLSYSNICSKCLTVYRNTIRDAKTRRYLFGVYPREKK